MNWKIQKPAHTLKKNGALFFVIPQSAPFLGEAPCNPRPSVATAGFVPAVRENSRADGLSVRLSKT